MSRQNSRDISNINVTLNGHEIGIGRSANDNTPFSDVKVMLLKGADGGVIDQQQADYTQADTTAVDYIKNKPTLGTASALDVPASGDASSTQVVKGDDTRLLNARPNPNRLKIWFGGNSSLQYNGSEEKVLDIRDDYIEISSTHWSSTPGADGYYTNTVTLSHGYNTNVRPIISCVGAALDTEPTAAQVAAFNQCSVFNMPTNTNASTLTVKAKTKPTETFYIGMFGFYGH